MNKLDNLAFAKLFAEAYERCFGYVMSTPLTESEGKHFSDAIFESTGLIIGWKSLKNYSQYFIDGSSGRGENPPVETLDTLSRYVIRAERTEEVKRKDEGGRYWFDYRNQYRRGVRSGSSGKSASKKAFVIALLILLALAVIASALYFLHPFKVP